MRLASPRRAPGRASVVLARCHASPLLCRLISVLDSGRDVNAPLQLMPERTPLEAAAGAGHLPLVAELLRRGADIRHRTTEDHDALTVAIQWVLALRGTV